MIPSIVGSLKISLMHPNQVEVTDTIWHHRADLSLVAMGKEEERPNIDHNLLLEFGAFYLSNEWLQIDELDWLLIDALIYAETTAYAESVLSEEGGLALNVAYSLSGGYQTKIIFWRLALLVVNWFVQHIVPPAIVAGFYFYWGEQPAIWAAVSMQPTWYGGGSPGPHDGDTLARCSKKWTILLSVSPRWNDYFRSAAYPLFPSPNSRSI